MCLIRIIQSIYDEFVKEAALTAEQYRLGDPQDPATTMGPLATERQVDLVEAQVSLHPLRPLHW